MIIAMSFNGFASQNRTISAGEKQQLIMLAAIAGPTCFLTTCYLMTACDNGSCRWEKKYRPRRRKMKMDHRTHLIVIRDGTRSKERKRNR